MGGTPNGHLVCKQLVNNTKLKGDLHKAPLI